MMTPSENTEHLSIPFQSIIEATENFATLIGKGGYGRVYKGQLSLSGELTTVAVKRLDTKISGQGLNEFLTEIKLLSRYKHPNLVSLLASCNQDPEKVLIYEYAHRGSLEKYLRNAQNSTCTLTWKQRLTICIDAARGLDYLHNHVVDHQRVIHRDIKSANILLDDNWKAMIADLGLSKLGRANGNDSFIITNACGTEGYCDPVYRQTGELTIESDVYSFGVVLFEVLCGTLCFHKIGPKQRFSPQLAQSYYKERKLNQIIDPNLKEYMDTKSMKKFSRIAYQCMLDDREGRPSMDWVLHELEKALNYMLLSGGNWIPISLPESWDQDVPTSNQAEQRVLSNLVATGALSSTGVLVLDESFWEHRSNVNILCKKLSDYNDLLIKSLSDIKNSLDQPVAIVELYKEVAGSSGRLVYESVTCVRIILSGVVQGLKASLATKHVGVATYGLKEILDLAKASGVTNALLSCLVTCGTSLMSGSSKLLRAACEACEAIWSLIDAFEIQSTKENAPVFPLSSMYSHSLDRINIKGDECGPFISNDYEKIVEEVTQAFLRSEALRVAFFYCLRQRLEASWSSVIKIILRCCLHNDSVPSVLCGLSNSSVVGGGGDNTIVSEVFSIISLCASFDRDPQPGYTNNLKSKVSNPNDLVLHACLFVASVARSIDSPGNTTVIMLTSSRKTQLSRLYDLAHHYSFCDGIQDIQPHSMSAMLALGYMCSLENNESAATSIREIALHLIPPSATLSYYLRMLTTGTQGDKIVLSYWHGFRDGCSLLCFYRIIWGGPLAIQDLGGSDIPQSLVDLLGNKHSDEIGLSPLGVTWTLASLSRCLRGDSSVFRQMLLTRELVKVVCDLISDVHLKLIRCWGGFGGGKNGVKDTVNHVVSLLGFPFIAFANINVLRNMEPCDWEEYIRILLKVGFPGQIIKCLDHLELKDTEGTVGLLSKMVVGWSLGVELVREGLLNPNLMKRLLDDSSPTQVKLYVLNIVEEVAAMRQELYENINAADILQKLKAFLTHEDPDVRGSACKALGAMCKHSSVFCSLLAEHNIISMLVDVLFDKHDLLQRHASVAIAHAARHRDLLYEDLRICIPQLANLLLSPETTNLTKAGVASCLGNLCIYEELSQDMISVGAIGALLKVVEDYSVVALDQSRIDDNNETLLNKALYALAEMAQHRSLVIELVSKGLLNPKLMKRLLDDSSPTQVKLYFLNIVSEVVEMDQIAHAAVHSDLLYEDLRICIPQLANLLLSPETDNKTKADFAGCLRNLCRHSDKLSQDMISKGAIRALLKVMEHYSVVALDQGSIVANNETLLYNALDALSTMCKHPPCRKLIRSSDVYPFIGQLRGSPLPHISTLANHIFYESKIPKDVLGFRRFLSRFV